MAHMEATILDTNFNIVGIVDDYQSMIWTERYAEAGDFELYGAIGSTISKYCQLGYFVTIPESNRAMIIESIEFSQELNKSDKILVSGRSLEALLLRRIVWDQTILSGETYGKVQNAVKKLLTDNAIEPEDTNRVIPNLIFLDSQEEDITSLEFDSAQFTGNTLYDAVKQFADAFDIGFKIELFGTYLVFSLFAGKNRSFEQSTYNYVVYSSEYDNLLSSDFKQNITNFSNVALVAGEGEGSERRKIKYYYDFSEPSGMNRYELFVDARDISSTVDDGQGGSTQLTDQEYEYELANRGASKLAEVAEDYSFDAQIDTINSYQYGTDYFIGDILQLIDDMGNSGQFRITEFIRSMDSSGYSAYPQFKIISRMDSVIPVDLQGLPARIASLPDCADDMPLKDLVVGIEPQQDGSGDPYPAGGGKNKFNCTATTTTVSSVTFTINSNGTVNTGGTAGATISFVLGSIHMENGVTYILNGLPSNGSNTTFGFQLIRNGSLINNYYNASGDSYTAAITSDVDVILVIRNGFNANGLLFKPMIRTSGDETYAPYSNIRPISGWDSVKVSATGKNLIDPTLLKDQAGWNTFQLKMKPNTTYTCQANFVPADSNLALFMNNQASYGSSVSVYSGHTVTVTTDSSGLLYFQQRRISGTDSFSNYEIQVEEGSQATTFEPYNGQTATIPLPHTVYGGELDIVSGSGSEDRAIITFDGSNDENWSLGQTGTGWKRFQISQSDKKNWGSTTTFHLMSDRFASTNQYDIWTIREYAKNIWLYVDSDVISDVSDLRTWLSNNPTQVCYYLATPTTYSATPTEITTQYGLNNIFADTGNINKVIYFKNKWR